MSSSMMISSPPAIQRRSSRIPGGFDDDNLSNAGESMDDPDNDASQHNSAQNETSQSSLHLSSMLAGPQDPSSLMEAQNENSAMPPPNDTVLEERAMNHKLMDVESSFLPELSHLANTENPGKDDTFLFGVPNENLAVRKRPLPHPIDVSNSFRDLSTLSEQENEGSVRAMTPPESYKTPAPEKQEFGRLEIQQESESPPGPNTSALEQMSSSPGTVARTVSRVQSLATMGGYETAAEDSELPQSPSKKPRIVYADEDATPKKKYQMKNGLHHSSVSNTDGPSEAETVQAYLGKRPKYLNSRSSAARLSYDSMASSNTDASDATLGADFALQSGGALPEPRLQRKGKMPLSRQTSLGSLMSDDEGRTANAPDLSKIDEESPRSNIADRRTPTGPITPRASASNLVMPSDTVIANNVRDIEVPGTFARQYRQERSQSPSKILSMAGMTPGPKRGLTLKEHRSTVEKLGKENFDLKMKIHFLDQALQKRSEDGVKEMITENVQLKSDRMRLEKDNFTLRKQVRELQKKLNENEARDSPGADQGYGTDDERSPTGEEELIYLRERVETNEIEIEKLKAESMAKETEKRRLAEMVRSLGDTRAGSSDVGSREERDMWKDMLEAETIAREQSEEDNKKLRDEIAKVRHETFGLSRAQSRKSRAGGSLMSRSSSVEQNAELERLRHEVSELQKTISAQASALTSRNKEKERLYQEIEDLKLGRMGGTRSVAGDSILDRSASRARSHSRASNGTRFSRMSDHERDNLDNKINELRDEVSQLRLNTQTLQSDLDEAIAELDAVDSQAQSDADQFNEELHLLTQERDNALRDAEEQDQAFQQLKSEAQEEIDGLGDELDAKVEECERFEEELTRQAQNVRELQAEMRSMGEGLQRLEQDAQNNLARYESVKAELDDANRELESMEKNLNDAESRIQRMTVQQESHLNQITFLREEQDGDKIKISDFESLLKKTHFNLESERQKASDLQRRIEEERQQRDMLSTKKEKDVQKMITDLNREATSAKEELRNIRKALTSRETDLSSTKERLAELEDNLRHILNDPKANSRSLISAVTKMQLELNQTIADLDTTRSRLNERDGLLNNRDQLLETNGLEYRKLTDTLERERQARRQDKHSFEQSLKSHQASARALTQNHTRIAELENARNGDRKRLTQLEAQFKDQLADRNQVLLALWKKLSAMCGPDWAHNNSLINGNLPSQEVIGNMLFWPGFSRNLLLSARQVEGTLTTFKDKIRKVDRDLYKDYQGLEHTLELKLKKLDRIEQGWEQMKVRQVEMEQHTHPHSSGSRTPKSGKTPELSKLKGENRLLKAELQLLQSQQHPHSRFQHRRGESRASVLSGGAVSNDGTQQLSIDGAVNGAIGITPRSSSMRRGSRNPPGLERHHTTNIVEHLANFSHSSDYQSLRSNSISSKNSGYVMQDRREGLMVPAGPFNAPSNGNFSIPPREPPPKPPSIASRDGSEVGSLMSQTGGPGQEKWIHRLRELERRLKAEREARLLDRSGMRKRLEERDAVNEELRLELERERVRNSLDGSGHGGRGFEPFTVGEGARLSEDTVGGPRESMEDGDDEATPVKGRR